MERRGRMALTGGIIAVVVTGAIATSSEPDLWERVTTNPAALNRCANEDGSGSELPCAWIAAEMGNGTGSDVLWVKPDDGRLLEQWDRVCLVWEDKPTRTGMFPC